MILAVLLGVFSLPAAYAKEEQENQGIALVREARALFDAGNTERALAAFRRARDAFEGEGNGVGAADMCFWMAQCLARQGQYEEALALDREMLARTRRLHGDTDHGDVAAATNNVAFRLRSMGRTAEALEAYREALAMSLRVAPGERAPITRYRNNVAACLVQLGRVEEALPELREVLEERRRLHAGDHESVATSLNNLAYGLERMGRPSHALAYYDEALAMRRRLFPADHLDVATSLNNKGICLQKLGRVAEALEYYRLALTMRQRLLEPPHPDLAGSLNNVGFGLSALGRTREALKYYRVGVVMYDLLFEDHPRLATALNNVAGCLAKLGRPERALPLHRRVLAMRKRLYGPDATLVARSMNNIARCLERIGKTEEAREHFEAAVDIARRTNSPDTHLWTANLAWLHLRALDDPEKAGALFAEAIAALEERRIAARGLDLVDRSSYFEHLKRVAPYGGMVAALVRQGRAAEALRYVERGRARSLLDLLERSRFDPVEEALRRARMRGDDAARRSIEDTVAEIDRLESETVRLTHALALARNRKDLPRRDLRELLRTLSEELATAQRDRRAAHRRRAQLVRDHVRIAVPQEPDSIRRVLGRRERMLVYALTPDVAFVFVVGPAGIETRAFELTWPDGSPVTEKTVSAAVEACRNTMLAEVGRTEEGSPDGSQDEASLRRGANLWRTLVPAPAWEAIREASRVYVVPHGALHLLPFEALVIREAATAADRRYWIDEGPPLSYAASGSALLWCHRRRTEQLEGLPRREAVLLGDPVFSRAKGADAPLPPAEGVAVLQVPLDSPAADGGLRAGDVILSYDGRPTPDRKALRLLVFTVRAAVEDGERSAGALRVGVWRMGERRELSVPGGELGADLAKAPPRDVFGERPYESTTGGSVALARGASSTRAGGLLPLPGTRREVDSIHAALAPAEGGGANWKVHVLLGEEATKTQLYTLAPRARYLHLATHQLTEETEGGSYSSLALTLPPVSTTADDGFLKLIDLLERWRDRLSGCEMVVLSACESRVGKLQADEGLYAMPWGFMYAGCPSVVASLWRVDDESTAELMGDFFHRLRTQGGEGKLQAFHEACRALRAKRPEPYYWAPFVFIGDSR